MSGVAAAWQLHGLFCHGGKKKQIYNPGPWTLTDANKEKMSLTIDFPPIAGCGGSAPSFLTEVRADLAN